MSVSDRSISSKALASISFGVAVVGIRALARTAHFWYLTDVGSGSCGGSACVALGFGSSSDSKSSWATESVGGGSGRKISEFGFVSTG